MRPRFMEDCVREMVRTGVETFGGLGRDAFLMARQENLETITGITWWPNGTG